jgi:hypothetical protein
MQTDYSSFFLKYNPNKVKNVTSTTIITHKIGWIFSNGVPPTPPFANLYNQTYSPHIIIPMIWVDNAKTTNDKNFIKITPPFFENLTSRFHHKNPLYILQYNCPILEQRSATISAYAPFLNKIIKMEHKRAVLLHLIS